jgi:3',5'-cyclic AMP phosphodiesterase CpdA
MVKRLFGLSTLLLSCLRVASPRAERDLEIGRAEGFGLSVSVDGGLAAVRSIAAARVHLWANAPELAIDLRGSGTVELFIENVLADAEIVVGDVVLASGTGTKRTLTVPATARVLVRAPDRDARAPYRFAMYADVQGAIDEVQDIYLKMNATPGIRFAIMAGDLTEHGPVEELERFQRELATLSFPVFATLGNHELGTPDVPYHSFFGRGSQSFEFRGVRFTTLDSASATVDPEVYGWLDTWLALGRDRLHIVSMHIAPIDPVGTRSGSFASRNEANKLLSRLAAGRVDLTLYGHVHSYYAFSNAGIPAHIAGGGGAIPERMDGIGRHFLAIDVDPQTQSTTVGLVRVD